MNKVRIVIFFYLLVPCSYCNVQLNPLFSSGAVLQQGVDIPIWGTAREKEHISIQLDGETVSCVALNGKWMARLKPHKAGGPFVLTVKGENTVVVENICIGEVWFCSGQSNMAFNLGAAANAAEEVPTAHHPFLRMFTVPKKTAVQPMENADGKWVECSPATAAGFSAVAYYFGRDIHKSTGVPVGLIHSSWAGSPAQAWTSLSGLKRDPAFGGYVATAENLMATYPEAAAKYPQQLSDFEEKMRLWDEETGATYKKTIDAWNAENEKNKAEGRVLLPKPVPAVPAPKRPVPPEGNSSDPTTLFNAMVAPIMPYAIKGVIWYQGESNSSKALEYRSLFPRLISDWRQKWGQGEFPFLFVQIAPYREQPPEIRDAQLATLKKVSNTAMVVTTDSGDPANIHPPYKEPVGQRLALAARALAYGERIEFSGPLLKSAEFGSAQAILRFDHIGSGLISKNGDLKGFSISGADTKFLPARASIIDDAVLVSSEEVKMPVAVRYGWANAPDVNLFNKEGLPASPFQTEVNDVFTDK